MSGILLRWLNEDLVLRQRVLNLEHDFSNGYLLGEILHIHNHQQDFSSFKAAPTCEAKVNNFILLEPSLRILGVPFDAQVAYSIMQGESGVASKLLYQVKMVLDRLTKFSVPISTRSMMGPAGVKPIPNLSQRALKPQYDQATSAIFTAAVRDMVQSQKTLSQDRCLQRFTAEGIRQKLIVQVEKERSWLAEELHTEAIRQQGLQDLAQRKALCNSWDENNVDAWMVNMGRKRGRESRHRTFLRKVEKSRLGHARRVREAGEAVVEHDLPDFEARCREIAQLGGTNQEEDEATPWAFTALTRGYLEARALEKGYDWQMDKLHAKRAGERTGAREKRRRRYITEREESTSNEHAKESMNILAQMLTRRCQAEELVEEELQTMHRYKTVMMENRKYREQQYAVRADIDAEGLLKRDQASLDAFRRNYDLGVRTQVERCAAAGRARKAGVATRVEQLCRQTLDRLVALSLEVVTYRAFSEHKREPDCAAATQDPMPSLRWTDLKWSFVRGGSLLCMDGARTPRHRGGIGREWGRDSTIALTENEGHAECLDTSNGDAESVDEMASYLDGCELRDYINETGWWASHDEPTGNSRPSDVSETEGALPSTPSNSATSLSEADRNSVLATANPLHALGECVIHAFLAASPLPAPRPPPAVPKFSLRICMCGRTLTGKSEQAIRLADRYCLKVLSTEELAQKAMDNAANAMAAGRKALTTNEALGQEATSALLKGGTISDKVYTALLVEAIHEMEHENRTARDRSPCGDNGGVEGFADDTEYAGWIVDDFPGSAEQAAVLEKCLSGYDEAERAPSRIDVASDLAPIAPPAPDVQEKVVTTASGMDLLIYIHVPREAILKRSLGRLYDPVTSRAYHLEGSLPQYDVVCKERLVRPEDPANASAQLSLQLAAQDESIEGLKAFAERFGTLRTVDSGDGTQDALFGKLNAVVLQFLQEDICPEKDVLSDTESTIPMKMEEQGEQRATGTPQDDADDDVVESSCTGASIGTNGEARYDEASNLQANEEVSCALEQSAPSYLESTSGDSGPADGGKPIEVLTGNLAVAISGHWRSTEAQFQATARKVFRELRNQRLSVSCHVRRLRDSFAAFLGRADDKQSVLAQFCSEFNAVEEDLRFDDRTRKELLLRTEECRSKLWLDIEERKSRAAKMLMSVEGDGWLERQEGMIFNHFALLLQSEVERFHGGLTLLHDCYHAERQNITGMDSVMLPSLLEPDSDVDASKDTSSKAVGKRDKGGGKKGPDSKGPKGGKGDAAGDPPQSLGPRTPLPPCLILPALVNVIETGATKELDSSSAFLSASPASKVKTDAAKKGTKRLLEVEDPQAPLAAALFTVVDFANTWGPAGFPVPPPEDAASREIDGTAHGMPTAPSPIVLHRAVWAQAEVLVKRSHLLSRTGEKLALDLRTRLLMVYRELQNALDARMSEEATAVEAAMTMARECIDRNAFIEHEWTIQGGSFRVNESVRLMPVREAPASRAGALEHTGKPTKVHALCLRTALGLVESEGSHGTSNAIMTPEEVVDLLLRLREDDGALPECWSNVSPGVLKKVSTRVLDPKGIGEVSVDKLLDVILYNTPDDILENLNVRKPLTGATPDAPRDSMWGTSE